MIGWRESTTWMGGSTKRVVSFFSTLISCGLCLSVGICTQAKANRTRLPTITQKAKQKKNQSVIFSLVVFSFIAITQLELFFCFYFQNYYIGFSIFCKQKSCICCNIQVENFKGGRNWTYTTGSEDQDSTIKLLPFFFYLFI